MNQVTKFGLSQPVKRKEDVRFLTGAGRYLEDMAFEGETRALFLRSPVAHGTITALDVAAAKEMPGVLAVLTADDLDGMIDNDMDAGQIPNRDGSMSFKPRRPVLASGRVRYVGEAIVLVVAETLEQARDALEAVEIEFDSLAAVTDTAGALEDGQEQIWDESPNNVCYDWGIGDEEAATKGLAQAAHTVEFDLINNRIIANPMENRGIVVEWDGKRMTAHYTGQGVWTLKDELSRRLKLEEGALHVLTHDVGGGFGTRNFNMPEHFAVAAAAKLLSRPVKWISDRVESMNSDVGGRDTVTKMVAGFDKDYRLTGLRIDTISNLGAYLSGFGVFIQSDVAARVLTGVYDIQACYFGVKGVFTNTCPIDAYRGAGRPEAQYALDRLMDYSARSLGVDPLELRRINFIKPEQFPYDTIVGEKYDVGDFNKVLDRALVEADFAGFGARKAASEAKGKLRGIGFCYYIESILGNQNETAKIEFAEDGMVDLYVGTQSTGQGHETVFAQFLTERAGIPFEKIRFVQGDSDRIEMGGGTGGSRSVTMQGTAINGAADELIEKMKPLAEEELEVAAADLVWEDGTWRVTGTDRQVDLMTLAEVARKSGRVELIVQQTETVVPGRSYPNGCHVAEVEVDPDTGHIQVDRYTVVDDFGRLMNPMLAKGQVHGGVAQGLGQAITEHTVYDADGQLLSASFMDYAMPRADTMPFVEFHHEGTPSVHNDIGMKGCGEAGTVGACAAVMNGLLDAVWAKGVTHVDMPATPQRVWSWLSAAKTAAE